MSHLFLFFFLFFVLSVLARIVFALSSGRRKARVVVEYVQKRGYVFINSFVPQILDSSYLEMLKNPALRHSVKASADIGDIQGLENGTEDWLAFTCTLGSKEVAIFNFSATSGRSDTRGGGIRYKVAKIKAAALPRFSLGRNSVVHTVENVVDRLLHIRMPMIAMDPRQYPEFSAHYWVRGSDSAAVTGFLSTDKVRFLVATELQGVLATNTNYLVYFESGTLVSEDDFDSLIAKTEKLIANLL